MQQHKLSLKLLTIVSFATLFSISELCEQGSKVYIKSIQCLNVSTKYVYPNLTCYATSFNRTCSTGTVMGTAKMPMNNFTLEGILLYKTGTTYREIVKVPKTDFCHFVGKPEKDTALFAVIRKVVMENVPHELVHECPYQSIYAKDIGVPNISALSLLVAGDYKVVGRIHAEDGELIAVGVGHGSLDP